MFESVEDVQRQLGEQSYICDKSIATCSAKFANVANFRGFPNIPGQDAVLRYASQDGGHEGNVL